VGGYVDDIVVVARERLEACLGAVGAGDDAEIDLGVVCQTSDGAYFAFGARQIFEAVSAVKIAYGATLFQIGRSILAAVVGEFVGIHVVLKTAHGHAFASKRTAWFHSKFACGCEAVHGIALAHGCDGVARNRCGLYRLPA